MNALALGRHFGSSGAQQSGVVTQGLVSAGRKATDSVCYTERETRVHTSMSSMSLSCCSSVGLISSASGVGCDGPGCGPAAGVPSSAATSATSLLLSSSVGGTGFGTMPWARRRAVAKHQYDTSKGFSARTKRRIAETEDDIWLVRRIQIIVQFMLRIWRVCGSCRSFSSIVIAVSCIQCLAVDSTTPRTHII